MKSKHATNRPIRSFLSVSPAHSRPWLQSPLGAWARGNLSLAVLAAGALPSLGQTAPATPSAAAPPQPEPAPTATAAAKAGHTAPDVLEGGPFEAKSSPLQPYQGTRTPAEAERPDRARFGQVNPWDDARTALEAKGMALGLTYTFDGATVIKGGLRRGSVAAGLLDVNFTLDTDAALGIEGGTFFAQYYFRHGKIGNDDAGTAQGYSNIDEARLSRAEEVWFEQKLLKDRFRVKLGQVDANSEFAFVEAAGDFINPSAGFTPTIVGFPTYPNPALSVSAFAYPTEQLYVGGGFYSDNFKELSRDSFKHPFLIGEIGLTHGGEGRFAAGRVAFGAWRDTASVDRLEGGRESGTAGLYVVAEQMIWKENVRAKDDLQGTTLFGQYGRADEDVSPFVQHVAVGIAAAGLFNGRDDDATGLRVSWVELSRASGSGFDANETNVEFFYKAQLTPFVSVKPGLQWIRHAGGQKDADDTVVATLRASIDF